MSTTRSKDRAGLCSFTFANGHRCRTSRSASHPHLCYDHARKESHARAIDQIGRDISYFFSGRCLSACDLSVALARLFSAVASAELKPRTASTLAYLAETLLQTIHLAQHEYINAFGAISWHDAVCSSVNDNSNHRNPPAPALRRCQQLLGLHSLPRLNHIHNPPLLRNNKPCRMIDMRMSIKTRRFI